MSSDDKFWLGLWIVVIIVISGVLVLCGMAFYYTGVSEQKVVEMVKGGANPIQARCSLLGTSSTDPMCMAFVGSGK
jgi:hypothetical protein